MYYCPVTLEGKHSVLLEILPLHFITVEILTMLHYHININSTLL